MLYRRFDVDEETPVQYAAVYVTRWRPAWGEPSELFREAEEEEVLDAARQLPAVKAMVEAGYEMLDAHGYYAASAEAPEPVPCQCPGCTKIRAALAPFEEADNA